MFLDVAVGIFIAIWASGFYNIPLSWWLLFWAVFMALLPDIDVVVEEIYFRLTGRKLQKHDHRDIFHYPLFYLLSGAIILIFFVGGMWASIFIIISSLHFLHDSIGIGWGVYWLYPFSTRRYSLFYHYDIFRHKLKPYKLVYSWGEDELEEVIAKYGDPHWVKNIYLKFHPYSLVELAVFIAAVFVLYRVWF